MFLRNFFLGREENVSQEPHVRHLFCIGMEIVNIYVLTFILNTLS